MIVDPEHPLPFARAEREAYKGEQEDESAILQKLNGLNSVVYPDDSAHAVKLEVL